LGGAKRRRKIPQLCLLKGVTCAAVGRISRPALLDELSPGTADPACDDKSLPADGDTMTENTKQSFEHLAETGEWPSRYDASKAENYNFITRRESVRHLLNGQVFSRVLDLGCGTGDYCELLSRISTEYIGVDFSPSMIEKASLTHGRSASGAKRVFLQASAESLPFDDNLFDLVCAIGFIEYFADPVVPMREIVRVLKPGGTLVIQSFQEDFFRKLSRMTGMNAIKGVTKKVLGRGGRGFTTDQPYTQGELDDLMKAFQFAKTDYRHNNYHVLPKTLRRFAPHVNNRASEILARLQPALLTVFAVNYVGRYVLVAKSR
jgi:ubiquinone/menaquinone biosynthesis C-methylase UbiE